MTVNELLTWSREKFSRSQERELETGILLGHVLGKSAAELIAHGDESLATDQVEDYKKMLLERENGLPIAYLTGTREFWSLPIAVNNQVLIPRHETELLVERVLDITDNGPNTRILELGTGSGAVALALALELPHTHITATDNSVPALNIAQHNQEALGLKNVEIMESHWFSNLGEKRFHLICSNPPYISPDDSHLQRGDVRFEPKNALVADERGYASIRHIVAHSKSHLFPGGWIVLEHGFQQGRGVRRLLSDCGFTNIETCQDLSGNDRVSEAQAD